MGCQTEIHSIPVTANELGLPEATQLHGDAPCSPEPVVVDIFHGQPGSYGWN